MIKSDLMNDFIIKNQWFFKTKTLLPYGKHAICRLLELGLSVYVLKSKKSLCFMQTESNFIYYRRHSELDFKHNWLGIEGDYRYFSKVNPYKLINNNENIIVKYYE